MAINPYQSVLPGTEGNQFPPIITPTTQPMVKPGAIKPVPLPETKTIPATSIGVNPVQIPPTPTPEVPAFPVQTIDQQAKQFAQEAQQTPAEAPAEAQQTELQSRFASVYEKLFGKPAAQAQAEQAQGVTAKTQAVNDIQAQINQLQNEANAAAIKAQGAGEVKSVEAAQMRQIERDRTVKALQLNSFLYAAQGNLATAQDAADRAVKAQFEPLEMEITFLKDFLDLNEKNLSREDKKRAEALGIELDERSRLLEEQKAERNAINSISIEAARAGADASLWNRISGASNQQEALQIMASDPNMFQWAIEQERKQAVLDTQIKEAQLEKIKREPVGGDGTQVSPTTQAIIDNPSLFDDLTPTLRGTAIAELQAAGYDTTNLGTKGLSDTAIKEIAQTQKALADLGELGASLRENEQFLGPISGWQKLNPWSKSRQVQADVDRVRQTVGKALEGGVLRKEDEEKYKKILATLLDTPATAAHKIEALTSSLQRDIENYKALQLAGGKSLDVKASLQKGGETTLQDYQALY